MQALLATRSRNDHGLPAKNEEYNRVLQYLVFVFLEYQLRQFFLKYSLLFKSIQFYYFEKVYYWNINRIKLHNTTSAQTSLYKFV